MSRHGETRLLAKTLAALFRSTVALRLEGVIFGTRKQTEVFMFKEGVISTILLFYSFIRMHTIGLLVSNFEAHDKERV